MASVGLAAARYVAGRWGGYLAKSASRRMYNAGLGIARGIDRNPRAAAASGASAVAAIMKRIGGKDASPYSKSSASSSRARASGGGGGPGIGPRSHGSAKSGRYKGKLPKTRKIGKASKAIRKGFENVTNVNGTISDADVIYMGFNTISALNAVETVFQALLLKLFRSCVGMCIENIHEKLQGYAAALGWNADGFRLQLVYVDPNTGIQGTKEYDTVATDSIYTIVGDVNQAIAGTWATIITDLAAFACGQQNNALATQSPVRLNIYRHDGNVGSFWLGSGGLDLRDEIVHFHSDIYVKYQNRSLSVGGSDNAQSVSSNPLEGYQYVFNGPPKLHSITGVQSAAGVRLLENVNDTYGVVTMLGGDTAASTSVFKEPVRPQVFQNCAQSSRFKMQPGEVQTKSIRWNCSLPFFKLLQKLHPMFATSVNPRPGNRMGGKVLMIGVSDMVNVNALEKIHIAYECKRTMSAYVTTKSNKASLGTFTQLTYDRTS